MRVKSFCILLLLFGQQHHHISLAYEGAYRFLLLLATSYCFLLLFVASYCFLPFLTAFCCFLLLPATSNRFFLLLTASCHFLLLLAASHYILLFLNTSRRFATAFFHNFTIAVTIAAKIKITIRTAAAIITAYRFGFFSRLPKSFLSSTTFLP